MYAQEEKPKENKSKLSGNADSQKSSSSKTTFQFEDNRPKAIAQRKLQKMTINSPHVKQLRDFQDMANNRLQSIVTGDSLALIQRSRVDAIEQPNEVVSGIVELMRVRAEGAAENMLYDFEEIQEDYRYFMATNEQADNAERFALMSIKTPPAIKDGENEVPTPNIDNYLWVEGLVSDPGSGLGGLLLEKAEKLAVDERKTGIALAAYEYDIEPNEELPDRIGNPYSVAGYYEKKRGYSYTGEAYEEVDEEGNSHFYPIYAKTTEKIELERMIQTIEEDEVDEYNVEWYESAKAKLDRINGIERDDDI